MKPKVVVILLFLSFAISSHAASKFSLDSIASWGKFPRFCINTYRWGCDFFNGFDTTYVQGTGYPFNVKIRTESWTDYYGFRFTNNAKMSMISDPSTSLGLYLTYLALSGGYDMNVSKYFGGTDQVRRRFNFQFNCMLFTANLYFISNDVGTTIKSFTPPDGADKIRPDYAFSGINNSQLGVDIVYFFRHKRYSQAAAFSYGRVQRRNGGSFFGGFSFNRQKYQFDFANLPEEIKSGLPNQDENYKYSVSTRNYLFQFGYGYNWVFRPKYVLGVSEAPMIGWSRGIIDNDTKKKNRFAAMSKTQLSLVYNNDHWFAGAVGSILAEINRDKERSLISTYLTLEISLGYRFKLW